MFDGDSLVSIFQKKSLECPRLEREGEDKGGTRGQATNSFLFFLS